MILGSTASCIPQPGKWNIRTLIRCIDFTFHLCSSDSNLSIDKFTRNVIAEWYISSQKRLLRTLV